MRKVVCECVRLLVFYMPQALGQSHDSHSIAGHQSRDTCRYTDTTTPTIADTSRGGHSLAHEPLNPSGYGSGRFNASTYPLITAQNSMAFVGRGFTFGLRG